MKLAEALALLRTPPPEDTTTVDLALICSFTPLHLQTFLAAHVRVLAPGRSARFHTGLYGDAAGSIERLSPEMDAAVIAVEWPDLDPRLGIRDLGGWSVTDLKDIVETAAARSARLESLLVRAAAICPVALSLPTLPFPPAFYTPGWQSGAFQEDLRAIAAGCAARLARESGLRLVDSQRLAGRSPMRDRLDVKSDLGAGFPYSLSHASALAELLALLLYPPVPKKGLVTDLDDTLWRGILGEIGVDGVSWTLDRHTHIHGVYQQFLNSLADAGVLIGAASKNDPSLVEEVWWRRDLLLPRDRVFPVDAHWGPKSRSVGRILAAWNVGADSVMFVDDSEMELAEVKRAHPEVECVRFPAGDDQAAYDLMEELRDRFGKGVVTAEDRLRLSSVRVASAAAPAGPAPADQEEFLSRAQAVISFSFAGSAEDPRPLELVNKTNQFNLNGRRYTEKEWRDHLARPDSFLLVVSFKDRFGALGKIAVLTGTAAAGTLRLITWVMSCRAFARRIEHQCLNLLFQRFSPREIVLAFRATPRNGPLQEFLSGVLGAPPREGARLTRSAFDAHVPDLYHAVEEESHG